MPVKVLLADGTAIMRKAIRHLLHGEPEIELVGEAGDFAQTIIMTHRFKPQIIIMDLNMPNGSKLSALSVSNCLQSSAASILAISVFDDEETKALAQSFGAKALLDKMRLGEELIPAVLKLASANVAPRGVANVKQCGIRAVP